MFMLKGYEQRLKKIQQIQPISRPSEVLAINLKVKAEPHLQPGQQQLN
jgi:hypothetical protein